MTNTASREVSAQGRMTGIIRPPQNRYIYIYMRYKLHSTATQPKSQPKKNDEHKRRKPTKGKNMPREGVNQSSLPIAKILDGGPHGRLIVIARHQAAAQGALEEDQS